MFFYLTDSLSEIYSDISCTSLGVNFTFCMQFTGEVSVVVESAVVFHRFELHKMLKIQNGWHVT